jgi:protein-S-isoprenylcysteine O-methyltransferase Ste14
VVEGHRLVTGGAYGFVRHPIYLAVALVWLGLAVAFASPAALLLTVLYVIPSYVFYMRSEEEMMLGAFGETYRAYQRAVPFLVPRLAGRARSAQAASA